MKLYTCLRTDVYPFSNLTCSIPCHVCGDVPGTSKEVRRDCGEKVSLKRSGSCEHDEHGLRRLRDIEPENKAISDNEWQLIASYHHKA